MAAGRDDSSSSQGLYSFLSTIHILYPVQFHLTENLEIFFQEKRKMYVLGKKKEKEKEYFTKLFSFLFLSTFHFHDHFSSYLLHFVRHKIKVEFSLPNW